MHPSPQLLLGHRSNLILVHYFSEDNALWLCQHNPGLQQQRTWVVKYTSVHLGLDISVKKKGNEYKIYSTVYLTNIACWFVPLIWSTFGISSKSRVCRNYEIEAEMILTIWLNSFPFMLSFIPQGVRFWIQMEVPLLLCLTRCRRQTKIKTHQKEGRNSKIFPPRGFTGQKEEK